MLGTCYCIKEGRKGARIVSLPATHLVGLLDDPLLPPHGILCFALPFLSLPSSPLAHLAPLDQTHTKPLWDLAMRWKIGGGKK